MILKYVDAIVCANEKYRFEVIDYINYSLLFIFVIESSYSLLFSVVSNIELISTFFLSISNPGCYDHDCIVDGYLQPKSHCCVLG